VVVAIVAIVLMVRWANNALNHGVPFHKFWAGLALLFGDSGAVRADLRRAAALGNA
jgi:general L-amino acid transport system permease protein